MKPGQSYRYRADSPGPPRRRLYISSVYTTAGEVWWEFVVDEFRRTPPAPANAPLHRQMFDSDLEREEPFFDTTDTPFARILAYPEKYAPRDIVWVDQETGQPVDIYSLPHG